MFKVRKYGAVWCGPCRAMGPTMTQLQESYKDKIEFEEIDIDTNPDLAITHSVVSVPTIQILDPEGNEVERFIGLQTKQQLTKAIDRYVG